MSIPALGYYHHHGLSLPFHVSDTMTKWSEAESFRTRKERIFNSTRYSWLRFVKEGKQKVHGLAQFVAYCISCAHCGQVMCIQLKYCLQGRTWQNYESPSIFKQGQVSNGPKEVKDTLTPFPRPYSTLKINPRQNIGMHTTSNVEHPSIKKYDDFI